MNAETVSIISPAGSGPEGILHATIRRGELSEAAFNRLVHDLCEAFGPNASAYGRIDAPGHVTMGNPEWKLLVPQPRPRADYDIVNSLKECVFVVESVAHLQGRERELLPISDRARGVLAKYGDAHSLPEWPEPPASQTEWSMYHGDGVRHGYTFTEGYGTFHITPASTKYGAPNGYLVQFTNEFGAIPGLGLWTDVAAGVRSPVEACAKAKAFFAERIAPAKKPFGHDAAGADAVTKIGEVAEAAPSVAMSTLIEDIAAWHGHTPTEAVVEQWISKAHESIAKGAEDSLPKAKRKGR